MADKSDASDDRDDPYGSFKFKLKWEGTVVAGFSKVSTLKRRSEVIKFREGGDPVASEVLPGQSSYEAITLEQGMTYDVAFEQWANKVWYYPNAGATGDGGQLQDFRKNVTIELYNEAGQIVMAYRVYNAWPSEYTALPVLDAADGAVAIQTLVLQNEGWSRDDSVRDPSVSDVPKFTPPSH